MPKGDGGHWPKGVRRNPDAGDWGIVLLSLQTLLDRHGSDAISVRALAEKLGVSRRAVDKWLKGVNRPDINTQERIATWIKWAKIMVGR
jgi:hypothetical protein